MIDRVKTVEPNYGETKRVDAETRRTDEPANKQKAKPNVEYQKPSKMLFRLRTGKKGSPKNGLLSRFPEVSLKLRPTIKQAVGLKMKKR